MSTTSNFVSVATAGTPFILAGVSFISAGESAAAFWLSGEPAGTRAGSEQATPFQTITSNTNVKSEHFIGIISVS